LSLASANQIWKRDESQLSRIFSNDTSQFSSGPKLNSAITSTCPLGYTECNDLVGGCCSIGST
ncbi:13844_t:CDS:1, partial [Racocetra persica]